jgi:hypothetical protein
VGVVFGFRPPCHLGVGGLTLLGVGGCWLLVSVLAVSRLLVSVLYLAVSVS